jgi:endonuclease-3
VADLEIPLEKRIRESRLNAYQTLVALVLSARTRDTTTADIMERVSRKVREPADIRRMSLRRIERLIYPAGFYRTKARLLSGMASMLRSGKDIRPDMKFLLSLPGVGRKVANLYLSHVHGAQTVGVDIHVFRISNRIFFFHSPLRDPRDTETALMELFPRRWWSVLNAVLVRFGQNICLPRNPRCPICSIKGSCPTFGKSRRR